jgi:toxin CptA
MRSVPAIAFDYRSSRVVAIAMGAGALLALAAIAACGLPFAVKFALAVVAVAYLVSTLRRFLRPSFDHAVWHSAGHWRLRHAQADAVTCELIDATILGPLIVLRLRAAPRRSIALVLLPDNCNAETRRSLRVRLARGIAPVQAS